MKSILLTGIVGAIAIGATVAGCAKHDGQDSAVTGQVVGRVGAQVITVAELNNEMRLANIPPDKQKDPGQVRGMLTELMVRKYLVQQAAQEKLDREPGILMNLMRTRELDLANAYVAQKLAARPVSDFEVQQYIEKNPARFAQRRMMTIEEISIADTHNAEAIVDALKSAKSLDEVDLSLNALPHSRSVSMIAEVDIPAALVKALKDNDSSHPVYARAGARMTFFQAKSDLYPLEGQAAMSQARQILKTEQLRAEMRAQTSAASTAAKYEGAYASIMAASAPTAPPHSGPGPSMSAPAAAQTASSPAP